MATHKSSEKRARQSVKRNARNRARRSEINLKVKAVDAAVTGKDHTAAVKAQRSAESTLARAGKTGALHWRTAARKTSRLAKRVKSMQGAKKSGA